LDGISWIERLLAIAFLKIPRLQRLLTGAFANTFPGDVKVYQSFKAFANVAAGTAPVVL
jgi:hypothetical protein